MSGKNVTKKMLSYAIKAGGGTNSGNISSEADRKWLNEAVKNISAAHTNLIDRLKECIQILEVAEVDQTITVADIEDTMEEIAGLCEDVDLARDFHKIGGFKIVVKYLHHSNLQLRYEAANVIATLAQNNDYCQDVLLKEYDILKHLLTLTLNHDSELDRKVAIKSMYAISCLVRQNALGIKNFFACNGFSILLKGIQSKIPKLQLKCIFLLCNLCKENSDVHDALNTDAYVSALLTTLAAKDQLDVIEFTLDALVTIICHHAEFRSKCKAKSTEFKNAISSVLSNDDVKKNRLEIVKYSNQLLKIIS